MNLYNYKRNIKDKGVWILAPNRIVAEALLRSELVANDQPVKIDGDKGWYCAGYIEGSGSRDERVFGSVMPIVREKRIDKVRKPKNVDSWKDRVRDYQFDDSWKVDDDCY